MLLKVVFGLVYWALYLLSLPLRLVVFLRRAPVRALKERAGRRDFTNSRRQSEFGTYTAAQAGQPNPFFTSAPDSDLILPLAKEGVGSEQPETICKFFEMAVSRHGDSPALKWQPAKGEPFKTWTWAEYHQDVRVAARALIRLGMKRFESVNILGFNSPEWFISNVAAIFAGGKAAGIYPTNDAVLCKYITEHSEARVVVVEDMPQLNKYAQTHAELKNVTAYVIYRPPENFQRPNFGHAQVLTWDEFMELGRHGDQQQQQLSQELEQRVQMISPGHCSTLIYTSGTTGTPKAVMISHDNLTWTARMILGIIPEVGRNPESWVTYLPLSHVAAQMLDIHGPLVMTASSPNPCTIWFARPDALRGTLVETLQAARPTIFFGVPRVWEKFKEGMQGIKKGAVATIIADWAKSVGFAKFQSEQLGSTVEPPLSYPLARILFNQIKVRIGLDRCRYCISGAAPISQEVLDYFGSLDFNIHQVYGMSECTGPATLDLPDSTKTGSCGHSMPGIEIKLVHQSGRDRPGEGEVCYRGRNIMMGYMKEPEKTAEAIDEDGWLHSGDLGKLDANGFLYITGRIKELIITAGGENIAPVPIEDEIKKFLPAVSNIMMIGDRMKFCTALVTLKTTPDHETGGFTLNLANEAKDVDPSCTTVAQAKASPIWHKYIDDGIRKYNQVAVSNAQKIQKFTILDRDFSVPDGDLTPTLKLKRSVCAVTFQREIESMYDE